MTNKISKTSLIFECGAKKLSYAIERNYLFSQMELMEGELNKANEENKRLSDALNTTQDERICSFARLQKALGGTCLTPNQPEADLEIEQCIIALIKENNELKGLLFKGEKK